MNFYILESSAFLMTVPFVSGVSFTSTWSFGSLFTSAEPKAKLNMTFYWHKPIHYRTVRKQDFFPLWALGTVTVISHQAPGRLTKQVVKYLSCQFTGKASNAHLFRHTYRQFPVLMGVKEKKRELSK